MKIEAAAKEYLAEIEVRKFYKQDDTEKSIKDKTAAVLSDDSAGLIEKEKSR